MNKIKLCLAGESGAGKDLSYKIISLIANGLSNDEVFSILKEDLFSDSLKRNIANVKFAGKLKQILASLTCKSVHWIEKNKEEKMDSEWDYYSFTNFNGIETIYSDYDSCHDYVYEYLNRYFTSKPSDLDIDKNIVKKTRTYRSALQHLSDIFHPMFHPNFLTIGMLYMDEYVITDCRYEYQSIFAESKGAKTVKLINLLSTNKDTHSSETSVKDIEPHYTMYTEGKLKKCLIDEWRQYLIKEEMI